MERPAPLTVYRECQPVVDTEYEPSSDHSPVEAIVDALAAASGTDPGDLPPLYEFVDPGVFETMFDRYDGDPDMAAVYSFRYDSWNVFVRADGRIRVCDATRSTDPEPVFESSVA